MEFSVHLTKVGMGKFDLMSSKHTPRKLSEFDSQFLSSFRRLTREQRYEDFILAKRFCYPKVQKGEKVRPPLVGQRKERLC